MVLDGLLTMTSIDCDDDDDDDDDDVDDDDDGDGDGDDDHGGDDAGIQHVMFGKPPWNAGGDTIVASFRERRCSNRCLTDTRLARA